MRSGSDEMSTLKEHMRVLSEEFEKLETDEDQHCRDNPAAWLMLQEAQEDLAEAKECLTKAEEMKNPPAG